MVSRIMITLSQSPNIRSTEFNNLVILLGRYFQIRDDYLNLASLEVSIQASL
jgi:geranylgeranyl pyrophosphate synthase